MLQRYFSPNFAKGKMKSSGKLDYWNFRKIQLPSYVVNHQLFHDSSLATNQVCADVDMKILKGYPKKESGNKILV